MPAPHRFPLPWTPEETDACFIVRDYTGRALAYVHFEEEPGRRRGEPPHTRCSQARCVEHCQVAKVPVGGDINMARHLIHGDDFWSAG
jgi:hypothetical protein